jgi:hypothetical protein
MLKTYIILFVVITLVSFTGCSSDRQHSQNSSGNSSQATPVNIQEGGPSNNEPQPQEKSVTVIKRSWVMVFGPDGKKRQFVELTDQPIKLAKGEWVKGNGKKYTGRASGDSEIWLESGEIKSRNVDISNSEK